MTRLIDADKLIDIIDEWLDVVGEAWVRKHTSYYGELLGCIEDAPTVDAVEVVRCKDCRYWIESSRCCDNDVYTWYTFSPNTYEEDYCSYAER